MGVGFGLGKGTNCTDNDVVGLKETVHDVGTYEAVGTCH